MNLNIAVSAWHKIKAGLATLAAARNITDYDDDKFAVAAFGLVDENNEVVSSSSLGSIRVIDCGMVSLRDAAIYGRTRPLIPYTEGRLINAVHFVPNVLNPTNAGSMAFYFATPNTYDGVNGGPGGYGQFNPSCDTAGLLIGTFNSDLGFGTGNTSIMGDTGNVNAISQICDCGPLIFAPGFADTGLLPIGTWQGGHRYSGQDYIEDSNGNLQLVSVNGVSGSTEPTWATSGDTVDGTVTWHVENVAGPPTAEVHVIVEVIEGVSPMPKYPASLEWVSPPTTAVAGEVMDDIIVLVKDQDGNPYTFFPLSLELQTSGDGSDIGIGAVALDTATGLVTFTGVIALTAGTYIARCRMALSLVADPIFSDPFDVTAP